ncbi:tRNA uracil 4-sulfurtransferase ThiI [Paenibacillus sp. NAIST15-1]|uniref:tRNA uracil 4-sulfurtransferase ThiI n=1 Tax=Paenibacillus sp. NAIST15-1 TaxID=1605994 RepID=UPI00086D1960|nr:tRNA uracil 4-sulfurtransferase ThiI [Paenibacillus sp. NAIST15-1]GAV12258.1 putative tRNA sulfurtransferase ThiI [Paenibacillus sp. NAIST15-1]
MEYDMILLRYGEITIKGKNRSKFEKAAYQHVNAMLSPFPNAKVIKEYGRLYVELNGEPLDEMIQVLKHVFGVVSISPVKRTPSELEPIIETAVQLIREMNPADGTTFKVSAKRAWKGFPHGSQEMNYLVSAPVLREFEGLKVDVRKPEIDLRVEVREEWTYVYSEVVQGAGGFPLASNGRGVLLLSGGIDSPVAGYEALRKGLQLDAIHFHSYPFTSERAQRKVLDLAQVLANYAGRMRVHMVPFTDIQTRLHQSGHDNLLITLMRRAMLRIATQIAEQRNALAIVTGDSLGQVASQTLGSMNVIGRATDLPLLRPLVTVDKDKIIREAEYIGTYDLSILPYEDCCTLFIPKSPATNPNLNIVEHAERSIPELDDLIKAAVENTEAILLKAGGSPDDAIVLSGKDKDKVANANEPAQVIQIADESAGPAAPATGDWF